MITPYSSLHTPRCRARVLLCVLAPLCLSCSATEGFECGQPTANDSTVIYRCDVARQFCVCNTNSCATLSSSCPSGLLYVASPFAHADFANTCVSPQDVASAIDQTNTGNAVTCKFQLPDAGTPDGGAPDGGTAAQ